jgi:chromosome segregation ATPase
MMMATQRIDKSEVFGVIEHLLAKGQAPTHLSVRDALGGHGSGPVLSRLIAQWFQDHGHEFSSNVATARSRKPIADIGEQMKIAAAEAAQVITDAEQARKRELDERETQLSVRDEEIVRREVALMADLEKLSDREMQLGQLIAELRADKAALNEQVHKGRQERLAVQQELNDALSARTLVSERLKEAQLHSAKIEATNAAILAQLGEVRGQLGAAMDQVDESSAARNHAMEALRRQEQAHQDTRSKLDAALRDARLEADTMRSEYDQLLAANSARHAAIERDLNDRLQKIVAVAATSQSEAANLSKEIEIQWQTLAQMQHERDRALDLASRVDDLKTSIAELRASFVGN